MTLLVEKLETLDKNNVLAIRREILALKNKLKECEASKNENIPVAPPVPAPGKHAMFLPLEPGPRGAHSAVGKGFRIAALQQGWGFVVLSLFFHAFNLLPSILSHSGAHRGKARPVR